MKTAPDHPELADTVSLCANGLLQAGRRDQALGWLPHLLRLAPRGHGDADASEGLSGYGGCHVSEAMDCSSRLLNLFMPPGRSRWIVFQTISKSTLK